MSVSSEGFVWTADRSFGSGRGNSAFSAFWARAIRPSWMLVAIAAAIVLAGCTIGPFIYASGQITGFRFGVVAALWGFCTVAGNAGYPRTALMFESLALICAVAFTVPGLSTMIAALGVPYQDASLLAADRALGFDWRAIIEWTRDRPTLSLALSYIYISLLWQPLILFPILAYADPERLRRILGTSTLALLITILIFTFVPARTGYVYLGLSHADFPNMLTNTGWGVAQILESIRSGERQLSLDGLVTFPSYHAVGAVLLAFGWCAVPVLRWLFVPINIVMLFSCVPIGSHYVVDVIVGIVLAFVCYPLIARYYATTDTEAPLLPWSKTQKRSSLQD